MRRLPGHGSVEEHPKGSGLYRFRARAKGKLETLISGVSEAEAREAADAYQWNRQADVMREGLTLAQFGVGFLERRELEGVRAIRTDRSIWGKHIAKAAIGKLRVATLTRRDIIEWRDGLRGAHRSRIKLLSLLTTALEQAVDRELLKSNPARGVKVHKAGGARATRRKKLDDTPAFVRFVAVSKDRKLGGIPATYTGGSTCPSSCALKDAGCYAEFGFLRHQWELTGTEGVVWKTFLGHVQELPAGQVWRHNIAGDLPGFSDALDVPRLLELVLANIGRRGFTFTHKPLRDATELAAIRIANRRGFTINLSADSLEQADERAELDVGPVVVTLPSNAPPRGLKTPAGRTVVVCPAELHELTCASCQLCAKPQRKAIIGFRAHGQWHKHIDTRLRLPVVQRAAN